MRRRTLPLALLMIGAAAGLGAAGCSPALLWYGHDPARTTRWEVRSESGQSWLEAGPGRRSTRYDQIVVGDLNFDARGEHFAVPVRRGSRWFMLVDFVEGPAWDGLAPGRFSDDGRHLAYAAEQAGRWRVVLDGRPGPAVDAVVDGTIAFAPGRSRLGYAATDGACVRVFASDGPPVGCHRRVRALFVGDTSADDRVLVDQPAAPALVHGQQVLPLPGLAAFTFDGRAGRWAAVVRSSGRARLVVDGETVEEADEIARPAFSPAGRLARVVREGALWRFALGDDRDPPYPRVGPATFSASGRRYGYVAGAADGHAVVVIDGSARGRWSSADGVTFSADERRVAYAVRSGSRTGIACDDRVYPFDVVVESSIGFSADGRHWGALVGDQRTRRLTIVVDGQRHLPFDSEELFGAAATTAADLRGLRGWVVAELEHELSKGPR